jgi:hypothetical protein
MIMPGPIQVKYTLSRAEHHAAIRAHLVRMRTMWFFTAIGLLWMFLPLISVIALKADGKTYPLGATDLIQPALGLGFIVLLYGWTPTASYRKTNPALRDKEQSWVFSEDGCTNVSAIAESRMDWKAWIKAVETRDFFLLYPATTIVHIVPKRAFSGPAEVDAFRELLKFKTTMNRSV